MKRNPQSGFTLLELVILGVAFLVAFRTISRITTHSRVNQAAMVVAHDHSSAVSAAAREREPIRILRGADWQSITVSDRATGTLLSTPWLGPTDAYALDAPSLERHDRVPGGQCHHARRATEQSTLVDPAWMSAGEPA